MVRISLLYIFFFVSVCVAQETQLGRGILEISQFIASDDFTKIKNNRTDLKIIDSLYLYALAYTEDDVNEALLYLTFSTIPYNEIPLIIPFINLRASIMLPHAKEPVFSRKNVNLPSQLFFDSPADSLGDRDKLPHFFGSAYLSLTFRWFDFTKFIGIFVEDFEENFYIQSKVDLRDIRADNLGNIFGKILKKNKAILPSQVLACYTLTFFRYSL